APLCPAGHLPHLGGDRPSSLISPIANLEKSGAVGGTADLPPCGGDAKSLAKKAGQRGAP
ncbi:MAG: hypothetical protein EOR84_34980, partial [Mesorhizobium sp.]